VKINGRLEILESQEAVDPVYNLLNLAVKSHTHRVGHWMLDIAQIFSVCQQIILAASRMRANRIPYPETLPQKPGSITFLSEQLSHLMSKASGRQQLSPWLFFRSYPYVEGLQ